MSKNQIFTSPLGIGLGIGIGTAVGAIVIGAISFSVFKYSKGKGDEGEGIDERDSDVSRSSSLFDMLPQRDRSFSEATNENYNVNQFQQKLEPKYGPVTPSNVVYSNKKNGGKHSKKIKRKRKGKGKNKFRTLKKV
jgi:hypothetical protein